MLVPVHRSRPWLLLGAFALLGLFAMHGLGGHGMNHAGTSNTHAASTHAEAGVVGLEAPDAMSHRSAGAGHVGCVGDCVPPDSTVHAADGSAPGGGTSMLLVLCLAVLAAVAFAIVLALRRTRWALLRALRPGDRITRLCRSARDRDPPCLYVLSVQRC